MPESPRHMPPLLRLDVLVNSTTVLHLRWHVLPHNSWKWMLDMTGWARRGGHRPWWQAVALADFSCIRAWVRQGWDNLFDEPPEVAEMSLRCHWDVRISSYDKIEWCFIPCFFLNHHQRKRNDLSSGRKNTDWPTRREPLTGKVVLCWRALWCQRLLLDNLKHLHETMTVCNGNGGNPSKIRQVLRDIEKHWKISECHQTCPCSWATLSIDSYTCQSAVITTRIRTIIHEKPRNTETGVRTHIFLTPARQPCWTWICYS